MAKQRGIVYLGYEDQTISDKNQTILDFTVNKIGGRPDWPPIGNIHFSTKCPLCGLHRLLVIQCYAPLKTTSYHRNIYVFACISPNCWIQSESWTCVRSQMITSDAAGPRVAIPSPDTNLTWCGGADDWDENDNDAVNGNISNLDNSLNPNNMQRFSDEDDESNSFEVETVEQALENLQMFDVHNANLSPVQGAMGAAVPPAAAAELEGGDEPGLVTVDTPTTSTPDLNMLLDQTAELPPEIRSRLIMEPLQFVSKYIYVEEEMKQPRLQFDDHVVELLNRYRRINGREMEAGGNEAADGGNGVGGGANGAAGGEDEQYEESAPAHGDRLFYAFQRRIALYPGQILRYSRDEPPLLGAPLPSGVAVPRACRRCGGRLTCELQLLPSFAATLQVQPGNTELSHLHFLSVLIFTCEQSCWQSGDTIFPETVIFQPEI